MHTISHFKTQLLARLPLEHPFTCPTCQATQRDQMTLMRHYALGHRTIFEFCSKEDLGGHRVLKNEAKNSKKSKSQPAKESDDNNQMNSSNDESSSGSESGSDSEDSSAHENKGRSGQNEQANTSGNLNTTQESAEGSITNKEL